jgi:uncharacterized protein YhaN
VRFLGLNVHAFGALEDVSVPLEGGEEGLFVIHGHNEAGKSTVLRAIEAALYGIPERTPDVFRFKYDELRIGARVRFRDGTELDFVRRKARKDSLATVDGARVDDAPLRHALVGVDRAAFSTEFGIDQERLRAGARALLEEGGDVAQSLFAAGLGRSGIKQALEQLESESDRLFRPRKSSSLVYEQLSSYSDAIGARDASAASAREYAETRDALEHATRERAGANEARVQRSMRLHALAKLSTLRPDVAERRRLLERGEAMKDAVLLAPDFTKRRRDADDVLRSARIELMRASQATIDHEKALTDLSLDGAIIAEGELVDELAGELASYGKDVRDLPLIERERDTHRARAARLLREVRFDPETSLDRLPTELDVTQARHGVNEQLRLLDALEKATETVATTQAKLDVTRQALTALPVQSIDLRELSDAIDEVKAEGNIDRELSDARRLLADAEQQTAATRRKLRIDDHPSDEFDHAKLPSEDDVEALAGRETEIDQRRRETTRTQSETTTALHKAERKLKTLLERNRAPSEDELRGARARRDAFWKLVADAWRDKKDVGDRLKALGAKGPLDRVFEDSVVAADALADRLRSEADAVAKRVALEEELSDARDRLAELTKEALAIEQGAEKWESDWQKQWKRTNVIAARPKRMLAWLRAAQTFLTATEGEEGARKRVDSVERRVKKAKARLAAALHVGKSEEATVSSLVKATALRLSEAQAAEERRKELEGEFRRCKEALDKSRVGKEGAEQARERSTPRYAEVLRPLGLTPTAGVDEVEHVAQRVSDAKKDLEEVARREFDCATASDRASAYEARLSPLAARVSVDLETQSASDVVRKLAHRLHGARNAEQRRATLAKIREEEHKREVTARECACAAEGVLAELCAEAKVGRVEDLDEAARSSDERGAVRERLEALETKLVRVAEFTCDELETEVAASTEEEDALERTRLTSEIQELDNRIAGLSERVGQCQTQLARVGGSDVAARAAQDAQVAVAAIETAIPEYLRARLAQILLRRRLEQYREENQAPILKRASALFGRLTCGSFVGVGVEDDDQPRLVGMRPGGISPRMVEVDGMSEGTRDQLYLALRLAALEQRLESGERLPFIVDDVLVNFDDDRAKVALGALSELAKKTQVLFFTHHRRLVEIAETLDARDVFVREL